MPRLSRYKQPGLHGHSVFLLAGIILTAVLCAGCVSRTFTVRTPDPEQVCDVYLDGLRVGKTPYSAEFTFYGTREITLIDENGAVSVYDIPLKRPWYQFFPLDLFSEVLLPVSLKHSVEMTLALQTQVPEDTALIRKRAHEFRTHFRKGRNAD